MTIKQLAAGCSLSPNAISLVERGEVAPTVATLCKIASALGVPASSLFQEVCPTEVVLTRASDHEDSQPVDQALAALTCGVTTQRRLSVPDLDGLGGGVEGTAPSYSHEFVLCLNGQIDVETDGKCYQLQAGDSLSFNGNVLHCCRNPGSDVAVAVVIVHPEFVPES